MSSYVHAEQVFHPAGQRGEGQRRQERPGVARRAHIHDRNEQRLRPHHTVRLDEPDVRHDRDPRTRGVRLVRVQHTVHR